ncbi:MAG TPA: Uma2 family endonuclease, partial [Bryobacteraceae bacterium]|nr:Uma2 family endonuclease [Bryobacteraceae bacterium]
MSSQAVPYLTPEQYLEIERAAESRSEYLAGAMYAMSGGSRNHMHIVTAISGELYTALRGRDCAVASTDLRLSVGKYNLITYPDVFVTCGPDQFLDNRRDTLTDASLIVEVLSPSTKNYDRGEKFLFYRSVPSLREYLLFSQDEVRVEQYTRQPDGTWLMREFTSMNDEVELSSIGCRLR